MSISKEEVLKVANLARLELSSEETESMTEQLATILGYVDKLGEVDCQDVEPTTHVLAINNAFRADEVKKSLSQEEALANAPLANGEAFVVPRII
ncbi:MAG: Asp-tRNA(Asn)/Glu-tRNA(Gln) amidotransferase GatCAB subunit C [Desulfobulbaceae bacterium]|nr:MAG: Asp-tRNA(Asn)/Glu-tRNA(Gln) amidotransferase GatCAB subunit C [Desulfobulbaceae bacterium]